LDNSLPENWIANSNFQNLLKSKNNIDLSLFVYPNPTQNILHLSATNSIEIQSVKILNLSGQIVMTKNLNEKRVSLNISKLTSGIYFILIKLNDVTVIKEIIKE
jgi:hypothetical protein